MRPGHLPQPAAVATLGDSAAVVPREKGLTRPAREEAVPVLVAVVVMAAVVVVAAMALRGAQRCPVVVTYPSIRVALTAVWWWHTAVCAAGTALCNSSAAPQPLRVGTGTDRGTGEHDCVSWSTEAGLQALRVPLWQAEPH